MKHLPRLLAALMASSVCLAACSSDPDVGKAPADTTAAPSAVTTAVRPEETEAPAPEKAAYPYAVPDLGGYEFTILNVEDVLWAGTYHVIDYEEPSGETVSDAIYARARRAEEALKMTLKVDKVSILDIYKKMRSLVQANEDVYDAAYIPLRFVYTPLTGEYSINLHTVDTLHLEDNWWNQTYIDKATVLGNKLYSCIDYNNIMSYTYSNVLYFNKEMVNSHGLALPYDAVRSGDWTYDRMNEYMTAVTNLNGDTDFTPNLQNASVYGFSCQHEEATMSMLNGSGELTIAFDSDGAPKVREEYSRLADVYDKLVTMLSAEGACVMKNETNLQGIHFFQAGRALFYQGPLGISSTDFRALEFEYGVLPLPKYDAAQDRYYTMVSEYTLALNIPRTASDPERSGAVIDYLSFLGMRDVIPVVQEALCYKGMRDQDSIEMFEIILDSMSMDIGYMMGWTTDLTKTLCRDMVTGTNKLASSWTVQSKLANKTIEQSVAAMELLD